MLGRAAGVLRLNGIVMEMRYTSRTIPVDGSARNHVGTVRVPTSNRWRIHGRYGHAIIYLITHICILPYYFCVYIYIYMHGQREEVREGGRE